MTNLNFKIPKSLIYLQNYGLVRSSDLKLLPLLQRLRSRFPYFSPNLKSKRKASAVKIQNPKLSYGSFS